MIRSSFGRTGSEEGLTPRKMPQLKEGSEIPRRMMKTKKKKEKKKKYVRKWWRNNSN